MVSCLHAGGDKAYNSFDVENMEPKAGTSSSANNGGSSLRGRGSSPRGRRCCSLPVLLASAALCARWLLWPLASMLLQWPGGASCPQAMRACT